MIGMSRLASVHDVDWGSHSRARDLFKKSVNVKGYMCMGIMGCMGEKISLGKANLRNRTGRRLSGLLPMKDMDKVKDGVV